MSEPQDHRLALDGPAEFAQQVAYSERIRNPRTFTAAHAAQINRNVARCR